LTKELFKSCRKVTEKILPKIKSFVRKTLIHCRKYFNGGPESLEIQKISSANDISCDAPYDISNDTPYDASHDASHDAPYASSYDAARRWILCSALYNLSMVHTCIAALVIGIASGPIAPIFKDATSVLQAFFQTMQFFQKPPPV
jgi:hypothetical protein